MFPPNPSMMPMGPSGGSPMGPPVAGSSPQSKGLGGMFGGDAMGRRGFKDFMSSTSSSAAARGGMMPGGAPSMMPSAPPGGMPMPVSPPMGGSPMMAPPIGGLGGMGPQPFGALQPMGMGPMGQPPMRPPMMQRPMQPRPMGAGAPVRFAAGGVVPMRTEIRGMPHDLSYITADEAEILELLGGTGERGPGGVRAYPPVNEGGSTGTSDRGSFDDDERDYGGYDPVGSIDGGQFDSGGIDTSPSYSGGGDNWDDPFSSDDNDRGRDYGGVSTYDPVGSTVGGQFDSGDDYDFGPVYGGGDGDGGVFSQPAVSAAVSADRDDRADIYDFGGDIYRDTDVGVSAQRSPSSGFAPESGVGLGPSSRALGVTRGVSPAADVDLGIGSSVTGSLGPLAGDDLLDLLGDVDAARVFAPGTQVAQNMLTQSDMDYLSTVTGRPYPSSALGTPISDEEQKYLDKRADDLAKAAQKKAAADPNWGTALGIPDVDLPSSGVTTLPSVDVDSLAPSLTNTPYTEPLRESYMPPPVPEIFIPEASESTAAPSSVPRTDIAAVESLYSRPEDTGVFVARPNVDVTDDYRADRREIYTEPGLGDVEYMLSISGDLPGFQAGPLEDYVTDFEDIFLDTRSDRRDFEAIPPSPSVVTAPEASAPYEIPREVVAPGYPSVTRPSGFDAPELPAAEVVGGGLVPGGTSAMSLGEFAGVTDRSPEGTIGYGALPADAEFLGVPDDRDIDDLLGLPSGPVPSDAVAPLFTNMPDEDMLPSGIISAAEDTTTEEPLAPITVDDAYGAYPADSVVTPPAEAEIEKLEAQGMTREEAIAALTRKETALGQFTAGVVELLGNALIPGLGTSGRAAIQRATEKRIGEMADIYMDGGSLVYNGNGQAVGVVGSDGVYTGFSYGTGFDADGNRLDDDIQDAIRDAAPPVFEDGGDDWERDCPEGYTFDRILRQCVPVEDAGDTGDTGEVDGDGTDGGGGDGSDGYSLAPIQQPDFYTSLYDDVETFRSGGPVMSSVDRFMASFG